MRSSTALLAAASLLGLAAASPLERRYEECPAPAVWHVCWDGWEGCCSVTPCNSPAKGGKSFCPDTEQPPAKPSTTAAPPACTTAAAPSSNPTTITEEVDWLEETGCKKDDSNCHWAPTFYIVKTGDEAYTAPNKSAQFYVAQNTKGERSDSIAVFSNIPDSVKKCTLSWYKPAKGIFYGTYSDGAMNISTLDTGDKSFTEAAGKEVSYKSAKGLIDSQTSQGGLDLGNWGWTFEAKKLNNANEAFDCSGGEVAIHFELTAEKTEASVIVDQVSKAGSVNAFVARAGWFLQYE